MHKPFHRRSVLRGIAAATLLASLGGCGTRSRPLASADAVLAALEVQAGGRSAPRS